MAFFLLLQLITLWKNKIVFPSPSLIHLVLDFWCKKDSCLLAISQYSPSQILLLSISSFVNPTSSSITSKKFTLAINFLHCFSRFSNFSKFHFFSSFLRSLSFSLNMYATLPWTSNDCYISSTFSLKPLSKNQQLRTLKGFGPPVNTIIFHYNRTMIRKALTQDILSTTQPFLKPLI